MDETDEKIINFLIKTKVSFDQLIKCYNFWSHLSDQEKEVIIHGYSE